MAQLTADDVRIISDALTGKPLSPTERIRLGNVAAVTPPSDPNYASITRAYAAVNHQTALPSTVAAVPSVPTPTAALPGLPSSTPSADVAAQEVAADKATSADGGAHPGSFWDNLGNALTQPLLGTGPDSLGPLANLSWSGQPDASQSPPLGIQTGPPAAGDASGGDQGRALWQMLGGPPVSAAPFAGAQASETYDPTRQLLNPSQYDAYSFSRMNEAQRAQLLSDQSGPAIEAANLADQMGQGQSAAYFMQPYVKAAMELAATGALAGGRITDTAMTGPATTATQLKAVEDYMRAANQPGSSLDPNQLMSAVLTRMANTPQAQFAKMSALGVAPPANAGTSAAAGSTNPQDEITATNNAMQAAGQLSLAPSAQQGLARTLAMAQIQYTQMLLSSQQGPLPSYPDYLKSIGIVGMITGTGGQ